jgi:hypothetical protein
MRSTASYRWLSHSGEIIERVFVALTTPELATPELATDPMF